MSKPVVYVTNLNCAGPGSLNAALAVPGAKYILFKVSGVIDCAAEVLEGSCYIAGQTSPGGIIVRGIIADDYYEPGAHPDNLIIRHIRSRGVATHEPSGYATDPLILSGVQHAIIDHCSFSNSLDEAVDISRSFNITIQHCLLAETSGDHADLGGMLLNYSSPGQFMDNISIHHNTWNRIGGRMPEFSCEDPSGCTGQTMHLELSNNLFWDQQIQIWHNADTDLSADGVQPYFLHLNMVGNYGVARNSYGGPLAAFDFLNTAQNRLYASGNRLNLYPAYSDYQLFYCCNDFNTSHPNTEQGVATRLNSRHSYPAITYHAATELPAFMVAGAGAFPRFQHEQRLMGAIQSNTISPLPVNVPGADDALALPFATAPAPPADADNDGMPDYWETANGLNPNVQDHNGTNLSEPVTGVAGYTNLEVYLNCLAAALMTGNNSPDCSISTATEDLIRKESILWVYPNPATQELQIQVSERARVETIRVFNATGKVMEARQSGSQPYRINVSALPEGLYWVEIRTTEGEVFSKAVQVLD